jgi:hypothetical protein
LQWDRAAVYRRLVPGGRRPGRVALLALGALQLGCVAATGGTVDPGPNFVVPDQTFNPDYFYCHVEPELIFARRCGPGDPSKDGTNSCHFNSSAVSGMALRDHPPVDCGGGDHPLSTLQTGAGSAAQSNLEAVSLEMSHDYTTAPIYIRPSGNSHPRAVFDRTDMAVQQLLRTWAAK